MRPSRTVWGLLCLGDELAIDREISIGRSSRCDVTIEDRLVSRKHARIYLENGRPVVEDLGSANGVFVNDRRIEEPTVLGDGDRVLVGTRELSVFAEVVREPSLPSPAPARASDRPTWDRTESSAALAAASGVSAPGLSASISSDRLEFGDSRPGISESEALSTHPGLDEIVQKIVRRQLAVGDLDSAGEFVRTEVDSAIRRAAAGVLPQRHFDAVVGAVCDMMEAQASKPWLNDLFRLHQRAGRLMSDTVIQKVARAVNAGRPYERQVFAEYKRVVTELRDSLPAEQRLPCDRILMLSDD